MTEITFIGSGKPIPYIYRLFSYEIDEDKGMVHFNGSYPISEKKEPTGTEIDEYEKAFTLPQKMYMYVNKYNDYSNLMVHATYEIEIYDRTVILNSDISATEQILYFDILKQVYAVTP